MRQAMTLFSRAATAILTLFPYNYFSSRVEKEVDAMEHFSSSVECCSMGRRENTDAATT